MKDISSERSYERKFVNQFSAVAYICVYNEADILPWTLRHLIEQGMRVYVIDNWSTDGSDEIARGFALDGFERFPADGPAPQFSLIDALNRKAELARASDANWCMHQDADEIRRSPRTGESLVDGFARVGQKFNAVNFRVYHFLPTDDSYSGDPEKHFTHYEQTHSDAHMRQVKAWKNTGQTVDLATAAGHFASFRGIAVAHEKFILKHYPLRTVTQAKRKVLEERLPRYPQSENDKKWHVQYRGFTADREWLVQPEKLTQWR